MGTDDDGDSIETRDEDLNGDGDYRNEDTDGDGVPDYLDPDSGVNDLIVYNAILRAMFLTGPPRVGLPSPRTTSFLQGPIFTSLSLKRGMVLCINNQDICI